MTKWEYKRVNAEWFVGESEMNTLGTEGWELVSVTLHSGVDNATAYFKRPLSE
jgi:hypothetical protein